MRQGINSSKCRGRKLDNKVTHIKHNSSYAGSPYSRPTKKSRSPSKSNSLLTFSTDSPQALARKPILHDSFAFLSENPKLSLKTSLQASNVTSQHTSEEIDKRLFKDLQNSKNLEEEFEIHQLYFTQILKSDVPYRSVLSKIKTAYDVRLIHLENTIIMNLKAEIKGLQTQLNKEHMDRQLFIKKIEKLGQENSEICRMLSNIEAKYNSLIDRLREIDQYDLSKIPMDPLTWKALALENQTLSKYNRQLVNELKEIEVERRKIGEDENRFNGKYEILSGKITQSSKRLGTTESLYGDTESEALVSGRPKKVDRPGGIPELNLTELHKKFFFSIYE